MKATHLVSPALLGSRAQTPAPVSIDLHELQLHSMYLFLGYATEMQSKGLEHDESQMDAAARCGELAYHVAAFDDEMIEKHEGYPGVFLYEVTEEMGAWLAHNRFAERYEFMDELEECFARFMAQGVTQ